MRASSPFVLSLVVSLAAAAWWTARDEGLATFRLAPDRDPAECGQTSTSSWRSAAPCFSGTIRVVQDACKATVVMPNGDDYEDASPTEPDYFLFATKEHGWCHLDLAGQLLECDYRCDERAEHCDHACRGVVTRQETAPAARASSRPQEGAAAGRPAARHGRGAFTLQGA